MASNAQSVSIDEEVNRTYEASLLKDIDVVFQTGSSGALDKNTNEPSRRSRVLNAVQAYEAKVNQLIDQSSEGQYKKAHRAWTKVATKTTSSPNLQTRSKVFGKSHWIGIQKSSAKQSGEDTVNQIDEKTKTTLFKIATELLSTEETYVDILYLLDQIFHKLLLQLSIENDELPKSVVNMIFQHLSAIHLFHSKFLLPQLKDRLAEWNSYPQIGDIMTQAGPFLKMYGLYVNNLDNARSLINTWMEKSKIFADTVEEIQKRPECKSIPLQEHMLVPVQRTPRYKLLLEQFLKNLPESSSFKADVESALQLMDIAAAHSNNFMKNIETSLNLVSIYNKLAYIDFDTEDITRTLIKEGEITKVAARNGREHNRYLYLFSDMLLCCKECVGIHKLQGKEHKISCKIDLVGMTTTGFENNTIPNVFCVHGVQKSIEFSCRTSEEKEKWLEAITGAIKERVDSENTFRKKRSRSTRSVVSRSSEEGTSRSRSISFADTALLEVPVIRNPNFISLTEEELGTRAPHWIKDQDVTMCMICSKNFYVMRRRHHCRACGWVVCSDCSKQKSELLYDNSGIAQRVCDKCFKVLDERIGNDENEISNLEVQCTEGIISLNESNLLSDFFNFAEDGTWTRLWCIVPPKKHHIYCYKAKRDVKAYFAIDLKGCQVTLGTEGEYNFYLKIFDKDRKLTVLATNEEDTVNKWTELISEMLCSENTESNNSI